MKLKTILRKLEKDYGWSFYDENKKLHLEDMQKQLILDVADAVAKIISSKPMLADEEGDSNPYMLTGEELFKAEKKARGEKY